AANLALPPGQGTLIALSHDGRSLLYRALTNGVAKLYLRKLGDLDAREIPGTDGAGQSPFFSPDDAWVGFFVGTTLMKVPLTGGRPQRISEPVTNRGATWSVDGSIVIGSAEGGLVHVSAGGGPATTLLNTAEQ